MSQLIAGLNFLVISRENLALVNKGGGGRSLHPVSMISLVLWCNQKYGHTQSSLWAPLEAWKTENSQHESLFSHYTAKLHN